MNDNRVEALLTAKAVETVEYCFELLTPMATHGIKSTNAEFRISSVRGVLHYLWRAVQIEPNVRVLHEREIACFGGIETEKKSEKSSLSGKSPLRIVRVGKPLNSKQQSLLPHRKEKKQDDRPKGVLIAGQLTTITVEYRARNLVTEEQRVSFDDLKNVMQLFFLIGSAGQRSRRGFGAVQLEKHVFPEVSDYLSILKECLEGFNRKTQLSEQGLYLSDIQSANQSERPLLTSVWVGKGFCSYEEVLKAIGLASHERKECDRSLGAIAPRFASPLWCTIRRIGGQYYPVISELQSRQAWKEGKYQSERKRFLEKLGVSISERE